MKNIITCVIVVACIISCTKPPINQNLPEGSMCVVPISLGGDYLEVSTSPLTKASNKTYYAFEIDSVQVNYLHIRDVCFCSTTYFPYAEGIFTDAKNLSLNLIAGHVYRIRCSIIVEQEDKLYRDGDKVFVPLADSDGALVGNSFVYSNKRTVTAYQDYGYMYTEGKPRNLYPLVDRYYGEIEIDTVKTASTINLDLERRNAGVRFMINPPAEGELTVSASCFDYEAILNPKSTSEDKTFVPALALDIDYAHIKVGVVWTREDSTKVDLSQERIILPNKTLTTLKIDVNERVGSSDLNLNIDDDAMDSGEEITIK